MAKYKVLSNLCHDAKEYAVGDVVEMKEAQAAAIPWAVEALPIEAAKVDPPKDKGKKG